MKGSPSIHIYTAKDQVFFKMSHPLIAAFLTIPLSSQTSVSLFKDMKIDWKDDQLLLSKPINPILNEGDIKELCSLWGQIHKNLTFFG